LDKDNDDLPGDNIIMAQEIPKRNLIDSMSSFEYNLSTPFLYLCNEYKCIPINTYIETNENTTLVRIPVQLEKNTANISEIVLLTYEMTGWTVPFLRSLARIEFSRNDPKANFIFRFNR
jgi:hypothetical protein